MTQTRVLDFAPVHLSDNTRGVFTTSTSGLFKMAVKSFNTHFRFLVYIPGNYRASGTANQQPASPSGFRKSCGQTQRRWSCRFARISIIGEAPRSIRGRGKVIVLFCFSYRPNREPSELATPLRTIGHAKSRQTWAVVRIPCSRSVATVPTQS